ncbi:serum amyloid P-component-like [Aquarana catesbeiana]|uniref:serum amyloid P-component-like n=1 Tax=Aquarana catesbeiana TaxID=8400 RepID=UPI003CC9D110
MELSVLVLLLVVPASFAQEDLEGKVFVFPKETNTAHVILRPTITKPLQKVSVCLRSYSELSRSYSLFSMATRRNADAFHIYFQPPYTYQVFINDLVGAFTPIWKPFYWRHICVTWDNSNAEGLYLWLNGKLSSERPYMRHYHYAAYYIDAESSIVLGQDQDSFRGGFVAKQPLVGEISDVHMWDYVLTKEDIQKVLSGDLHGNVINWNSLHCEIKGEVLVKPEPQRLEGKVFVFPKETDTDHVILKPTITRPLQKVSVCLRSYTDLSRPYTPFSLATPGKDNAFVIYLQPPNTCSVYINQELSSFKTDSESLDWRHICVTWDSNTGVVQLWVNGKLYPRRVSMNGSSIAAETSIVLGQEQDSFGGKFDDKQSLVGEISDVHMWDYVLTPENIKKVISGEHNGNVINWISLYLEIKGEVLVQPKFQ